MELVVRSPERQGLAVQRLAHRLPVLAVHHRSSLVLEVRKQEQDTRQAAQVEQVRSRPVLVVPRHPQGRTLAVRVGLSP